MRLAQGRSGREIAGDLVLGQETVARHLSSLADKIKVADAAAAAAYVAEKGLAAPAEGARAAGERPAPALRVILVSDVVASGAMIHRAGDARAHDLMRVHDELIRSCLGAHDGTEITHTGDGLEASFESRPPPSRARRHPGGLRGAQPAAPGEAIQVRIGLNAGEPISTEGRLFGTAVYAAFRICARAGPGQILVSDVVGELVAGKGFTLTSRGRVVLKGSPGPHAALRGVVEAQAGVARLRPRPARGVHRTAAATGGGSHGRGRVGNIVKGPVHKFVDAHLNHSTALGVRQPSGLSGQDQGRGNTADEYLDLSETTRLNAGTRSI